MVAIKFLGLIVTFYLFVEAFGQNFYPARYGKREENGEGGTCDVNQDAYRDKSLSENRRTGRSDSSDVLNRKIGFFISGGRFGKRDCSENCFGGSKEVISSGYQTRQDRSDRIRIPIRKNQFMMGSRFGKRMEGQTGVPDSAENVDTQNLKCIFVGIGGFYRCLEGRNFEYEGDAVGFNSNGEFQ